MRIYFLAILMLASSYSISQTEEEKIEYIRSVFKEVNEFLNQGKKPTYVTEDRSEGNYHTYKFYSNEGRLYKVEYVDDPVEGGPTEKEYYYDENNQPVFIFMKYEGFSIHGPPYIYDEKRFYIDKKVIKKLHKRIKTGDAREYHKFKDDIANIPNEEVSFSKPVELKRANELKQEWESKCQTEAQAADDRIAYVKSVFKEVNKATNDGKNLAFKLEGDGSFHNFYSREDRLYKIVFTENTAEGETREVTYYYGENNEPVSIVIKDEDDVSQGAPYTYHERRLYIDKKVFKKLQKIIKTNELEEYERLKEKISDIPDEEASFEVGDELIRAKHLKKVWQARR